MKQGDETKLSDIQIGDYFQDETGMKFQKVPPQEIYGKVYNYFDLQTNNLISVSDDIVVTFIKHSPWDDNLDNRRIHWPSIEEDELEYQVEFYTNFIELTEKYLDSEINESTKQLQISDEPNIIRNRLRELDEYSDLFRKSFFVSLCSYLESRLNNECELRKQEYPEIKVTFRDIKGTGIKRARTYLVKVLGSNFPFATNTHWEEIQWFMKLRNCIVHNESIVTNDVKLQEYIEKNQYLTCGPLFGEDYLMIYKGFCNTVLSTMQAFLRSLLHYREADKI